MNASILPGTHNRFAKALPRFLLVYVSVLAIHSWGRLWSFDKDVPSRRVCVCACVCVCMCVSFLAVRLGMSGRPPIAVKPHYQVKERR